MNRNQKGLLAVASATVAMKRACRWRNLLAGWQLGTRSDKDPECAAVADHRSETIQLRIELAAITEILLEAGILDAEHMAKHLELAAGDMERSFEARFPGVKATNEGLSMDVVTVRDWMAERGWKP